MTTFTYHPTALLKNPHLQTILSSSSLRKRVTQQRSKSLLRNCKRFVFTTPDSIQIESFIHQPTNNNGQMVVMLHGWEGSSSSSYLLSTANSLFNEGFIVVRINFRDHGDTHHLNKLPFNSVRLKEVSDTIEHLSHTLNVQCVNIIGFSLGGNFSLRLAANKSIQRLPINKILAVCPAIDPVKTSYNIEAGNPIYHSYFVKKWKASLAKKYQYFPEIMRSHQDLTHRTLNTMNDVFVPLHTDYNDAEVYLSAYAVSADIIDNIKNDTAIIYSLDDPIIDSEDFNKFNNSNKVTLHPQKYGGHCAFLKGFKLNGWVDDIAVSYFTS